MTDQFILFTLADTTYALKSRDVAHIEMVDTITRVPNAPSFVDGVVFSRGEVVPAVNLRARFGFERAASDVRTRLVVVKDEERAVGLIVDAAREFASIPEEAIQPPNEALAGTSGKYLQGIASVGGRMVLVLNLAELLAVDLV